MEKNKVKEPISKNTIFKIMLYVAFIVAGIFLIKNIISKELSGAISIGVCLGIFTIVVIVMKKLQLKAETQQLTVSVALMFLVFFISISSGAYYSDDYSLYLAVYGLTGLYLRPSFTKVQVILGDVLFIIQYILHPEKTEGLGQFIMCMITFTVAGLMFYLVIERGRSFITRSRIRAEEAETLINSIKTIGEELQQNFQSSSKRINSINEANDQLNNNANELKSGSQSISSEAKSVSDACIQVNEKINITESQIDRLNHDMKAFESVLMENQAHMTEMSTQMTSVQSTMHATNQVFRLLNEQMEKITSVTEHLNKISSSTTMLALNASIEAARAGHAGSGFAVVASKVQDLAVDSTQCANEVAGVVNSMRRQIEQTSEQLSGSADSIDTSLSTLNNLNTSFGQLGNQFTSLYGNIEEQNNNISQVNMIFEELKDKISDMSAYSEENEASVQAIAEAMDVYKDNISMVLEDTKQIHELSESMLSISNR